MNYITGIDTLGLRVEFNNSDKQRSHLRDLLLFIRDTTNITIRYKETYNPYTGVNIGYHLYYASTTIAIITTGFFQHKSNSFFEKPRRVFYININFAGLRRYDEAIDTLSMLCVRLVCAYFNTSNITWKLRELDIFMDMECDLDNVLALCVSKSPRTKYYAPYQEQMAHSTVYIENISKKQLKTVMRRAYVYDKSIKANLDYSLTRFELKLRSQYFNTYGFSIDSIAKALNKYLVMYFEDIHVKNEKIQAYLSYSVVKDREIKRLALENFKVYPDIQYINMFLYDLQTIKMEHLNLPELRASKDIFEKLEETTFSDIWVY